MLESFGARLRQQREQQGIPLIAIAQKTKIKLSLLEALERDDVSHWPSGIYRRAYIRAYAQAIGLEPDAAVREFLEVHPEPGDVEAREAIAAAAESARMNAAPPTRLRTIMGSALGSLARLRRSPEHGDPGLAARARVDLPAPVRLDFRVPAEPSLDSAPVEAMDEGIIERTPVEPPDVALAACPPQIAPTPSDLDLLALADLCTGLGRAATTNDLQPLLQEAARILDATGLIVWIWDASAEGLSPALAHGYPERVLAQLPTVPRDADNATAAAFRSARACAINGSDDVSGALVVPLLTPQGCAGVLAIELPHGREQTVSLRAAATIFAALLAQLAGASQVGEAQPPADVTVPREEDFMATVVRANG